LIRVSWSEQAKNILKSEIKRKGLDYKTLLTKLAEIGVEENYSSFTTKVNRGTFSFAFFLQCMKALGVKKIDLE
jgi:hypothetical protein